nr:efflux RND transporter periplasmic adaptor subunit [candidate division Zixibacteria bacterium]
MKKKIIVSIIVLIVLLGAAKLIYSFAISKNDTRYQFAEVTRGNLETVISASGTLSPVTIVEVGTQVSGTIDSIYVDYNDHVKKGQLLAVLDTTLLKASLLDAEAGMERVEAQLEQAQADFERYHSLFEKDLISEADFLPYQISVKTQKASLKSAEAAYQRAVKNLQYAVITSPIDGIVIEKNVEGGQTVAASFSTPTLFMIAEDLNHMQIEVDVDESDIGSIKEGQQVRFDVQTYSNKEFTGSVTRIRLQPQTVSNVVTYTVIVDAANSEGLLLPGMTATVDFIIEQKKNVLLVPNTCLRFQPSEEEMAKAFEKRKTRFENMPDSLKPPRPQQPAASGGKAKDFPSDLKEVWYLDSGGSLAMAMVKTGLTDGSKTEIVESRDLKEGMQVISSLATSTGTSSSTQKSQMQTRPPMPGPGF